MDYNSHILFFIFYSLLFTTVCYGQKCNNEISESRIQEIQNLSFNLELDFAEDAIDIEKRSDFSKNCQSPYKLKLIEADIREYYGDLDSALFLIYDVLLVAKEKQWQRLQADALLSSARINEIIGKVEESDKNLIEAKSIIDRNNFSDLNCRYFVRRASHHRVFGQKENALKSIKKAIANADTSKYYRAYLDALLVMSLVHPKLDSMIYYSDKASSICIKNNNYGLSAVLKSNNAKLLLKNGQLQRAKEYLDEINDDLYRESNSDYDSLLLVQYHYGNLEMYYQLNNEVDSAYKYLQLSSNAKDLTNEIIRDKETEEIEAEYEMKLINNQLKYSRNRSTILSLITLAFIPIIITVTALFLKNRNKKREIQFQSQLIIRKNSQLDEKIEEQKLLMSEIHHRIKNNLQQIISLMTLQKGQIENDHVNKLFTEIQNKISSISIIHNQLYSNKEFTQIDVYDYFNELFRHLNLGDSSNISFDYSIHSQIEKLSLDTITPLALLITELVNNSIKYVNGTNSLSLNLIIEKADYSYIKITYKDNGPGYTNGSIDQENHGLGYSIINAMVKQLKGNKRTYNKQGAVFEMMFKEKVSSSL